MQPGQRSDGVGVEVVAVQELPRLVQAALADPEVGQAHNGAGTERAVARVVQGERPRQLRLRLGPPPRPK